MRLSVLSPSQDDNIDGPVLATLRQLPCKVDVGDFEADATIVPITRFDSFKIREDLHDLLNGKPWVLMDYSEFGWDDLHTSSYLWGQNRIDHPSFHDSDEYRKFDQFVRDRPPVLTFQRELLEKDRTDRLIPIEYCSWLPESGNDPPEDFAKRPLDVLFNWGRSSESRLYLHAAIFTEAGTLGYDIISQWDQIDRAISDNRASFKWATIFSPHYSRIDVHEVQKFTRKAKVALIAEGAGRKTFRHGEVCQDAIMAIPRNNLAWSYPWHQDNSIVLPDVTDYRSARVAVKQIRDALMRPDLYQLYGAAMDNSRNYEYHSYLNRWVVGNIKRAL